MEMDTLCVHLLEYTGKGQTSDHHHGRMEDTLTKSIEYADDLFTRDPPVFTLSVPESGRGPTITCIIDHDIPCKADFYKNDKIQVNFLVVGLGDTGFSKVPYANQNGKTVMGENPKPLSEWDTQENAEGKITTNKNKMICYAYLSKKGKMKDKGPRVDGSDPLINDGKKISYSLEPGKLFYPNHM